MKFYLHEIALAHCIASMKCFDAVLHRCPVCWELLLCICCWKEEVFLL